MTETKLMPPTEAHYTVYKLTDPEGKIYIGLTGTPVERRWGRGKNYCKPCPIRLAIDRYGWDAFEKEILCEHLTKAGGEKLEKWFVEYYDSLDPEKGYNRFTGGSRKGARMSEPAKQNMREVKNGQYAEQPELAKKIRNTVKTAYENDPDYRNRVSRGVLEAYERDSAILLRVSISIRQLWQNPEYRRRAVAGKVAYYDGNTEAACGKQKSAVQYYRTHPEVCRAISEQMSRYLLSPEGRKFVESDNHPKPVRCVETGDVFPSQQAAERATGFTNIHKVCHGLRRTAGGYHWEYV